MVVTHLVITPAFPQRYQRVDRNVLKYSASSGIFPVTQRFHDSIHDQVTGANQTRIVFPLEEPNTAGGEGWGNWAFDESAGFLNFFKKIIAVSVNKYQI